MILNALHLGHDVTVRDGVTKIRDKCCATVHSARRRKIKERRLVEKATLYRREPALKGVGRAGSYVGNGGPCSHG